MRLIDGSRLYSFYHAINIIPSGIESKNQVISMLKSYIFFFRSDLAVGIFSVGGRTKSVEYGVDDSYWDTVDIF